MMFACIQDCSVCPFGCRRRFFAPIGGTDAKNPIPKVIQKSFEDNVEKSEDLTVPDSIIPDDEHTEEANNAIQEAQNLPVLAEVQYSVETVQKRGLFNRFKKEK